MAQLSSQTPGALILRRAILDWRDKHTEAISNHFRHELPVLFIVIEKELEAIPFRELIKDAKSVNEKRIKPIFDNWLEREVLLIKENAQTELQVIIDKHIIDYDHSRQSFSDANSLDVKSHILKAAGATGTGIVAIPIFTSLSTASAGGILGVLGITVFSWPIALTGFLIVGGLVAFGGHKTVTLKKKVIGEYSKNIRQFLTERIFGSEKNSNSVSESMQKSIETTASKIMREISI